MSEHSANSQDSAQYDWHSPPQSANVISVGSSAISVPKKHMCPECGAHVARQVQSCPDCGENLVRVPKQIRCMHCQTTASSELVLCPGCGRELREAPPKLVSVGAPALLTVLLVALLVTQWSRISPLAWARSNVLRGVVLVEDISARIEPEMLIVMTPIVPETTMMAVGDASPSISGESMSGDVSMAVAMASESASEGTESATESATESGTALGTEPGSQPSAEPEVLAASVVQELPFGVGGPQADGQEPTQEPEPVSALAFVPETLPTDAPATATPLPPTATQEPTPVPPTPTPAPPEVAAVQAAGLAATLADDAADDTADDVPAPTASPTWTVVVEGDAERSGVQVAALGASETALPTPTLMLTTMPTPTVTPVVYQVRAGDTLVSIASSYGVDVEELMAANDVSAEDVYVIQPGQMLFVPVPTPEAAVAVASDLPSARVAAPQLLVPTSDARVSCATGGALIWQSVQFVKDSDKYILHLGFVDGRSSDGQESVTWVLAQSSPVTVTEWQLDTSLCELATDDFDRQWRWWVEVVESANGETISVSPPSEIRGFTWQ